jgi:flagellin
MAKWKKVVVSGSSAELSGLTLDTQLAVGSGGTGLTTSNLTGQSGKSLAVNVGEDGFTFADASAPGGTISSSAAGTAQGQIKLNGVDVDIKDMQITDTPHFVGVEIGNAADTTITRVAAGQIAVEGNNLLRADGDKVVSGSAQVKDLLPIGTVSGSTQVVASTFALNGQSITTFSSSAALRITTLEDAASTAPLGTISASAEGSAQGTIALNGVDVNIKDMQTDDSPTFTGLTLTGNANIAGNLVVQGTASFQNTQNLLVSDKFIMLASGSGTATDGGIVIEQSSAGGGKGAVFAYDGLSTGRWGIDLTFSPTSSVYTPQAFMSAVVEGGTGVNVPDAVASPYTSKGNIFVGDNEDIYIYS